MTRTPIEADKFAIVDRLQDITEGREVSRFLKDKLVGLGYLEMTESRAPGQRGKTSKSFAITGKGRGYIAIARSWKRKQKKS